jgi:hypothetical protein
MKIFVLLFFCVFAALKGIFAAEISKTDIVATVEHLRQLTHESQQEATAAKAEAFNVQKVCDSLANQLKIANEQVVVEKTHVAQAEKERDALIWVFAIACGGVALSAFRPALQVIQMPWQLVALAGVFFSGFALGFSIGRWALRFLAEFTPHLPF